MKDAPALESSFGWAIVGPGQIAHRFADAVSRLPGAHLAAVQGRDRGRAQAFAQRWADAGQDSVGVTDGLDALLGDSRVQAVYVATPHAFHGDAVRRCLAAGKPVLCEKPLVPNLAQGATLVALARERQVFLMEAMWTRFLPIHEVVLDWLHAGAIGNLRGLQSSFCFNVPFDPRHRCFDPAQAGGALLDIGIYNLAVTRWVLQAHYGACPPLHSLQTHGSLGPTGVDHRVSAQLGFADGQSSQFVCAFDSSADNSLRIFGTQGHIVLPERFWEATEAVLVRNGEPPQRVLRPFRINGFEGEIEEAMRCIAAGEIESPRWAHEDSLAILDWMDRIRGQLGVRYPFE